MDMMMELVRELAEGKTSTDTKCTTYINLLRAEEAITTGLMVERDTALKEIAQLTSVLEQAKKEHEEDLQSRSTVADEELREQRNAYEEQLRAKDTVINRQRIDLEKEKSLRLRAGRPAVCSTNCRSTNPHSTAETLQTVVRSGTSHLKPPIRLSASEMACQRPTD